MGDNDPIDIANKAVEIVTKGIDEAKNALDKLFSTFSEFGGFNDKLIKMSNEIENYADGVGDATKEMKALTIASGDFFSLATKFDGFNKFGVEGAAAIGSISSQFKDLISRFGGLEGVLDKITSKAPAFAKFLGGMTVAAAGKFLDGAEQGAKLEQGMLHLMAATGQLNRAFEVGGKDLGNLSDLTGGYAKQLGEIGAASNMTQKQVVDYVMALGTVPGVMEQNIKYGTDDVKMMQGLTAVTKLAALAQVDAKVSAEIMRIAYEKLGNPLSKVTDSTQKGVNLFTLMIDSTQKLGLRFDDTRQFLENVAEEFKYVGDNTEGANKVLNTFSVALQNTGLTAKGSLDIIDGMVKSVSDLSTGTKALLSIRSGGPGGLQGAYRIDRLLREGNTSEVIQMMLKSLRQQIGGRVVGLDEADKSPQAAAQFKRQTLLLQSGAFGGLVKNEQQANKLVDALSKGQLSGAADLLSQKERTNEVLSASIDKGTAFQERQAGTLSDMLLGLDEISANTAVMKNEAMRRMVGTDTLRRRTTEQAANQSLVTENNDDSAGRAPSNYSDTSEKGLRVGNALLVRGAKGALDLPAKAGNLFNEHMRAANLNVAIDRSAGNSEVQAGQEVTRRISNNPRNRMAAEAMAVADHRRMNMAHESLRTSGNAQTHDRTPGIPPKPQNIYIHVDVTDGNKTLKREVHPIELHNIAGHGGGGVDIP